MALPSSVPTHEPVVHGPVYRSYDIKGSLEEQRKTGRQLLARAGSILQQWKRHRLDPENAPCPPEVNPDMARWALERTDHTTLRDTRNEDADWIRRMTWEASHPFTMRGVCTWPDEDKIGPLVTDIRNTPGARIIMVANYPHGAKTPAQARKNIAKAMTLVEGAPNNIDIDTVIPYKMWLAGNRDKVQEILKAEGAECRKHGATWKCIIEVTAMGAGSEDAFKNIYDASMMALEAGADFVKTSTGVAAQPPYNDDVTKDTGFIARALPMIVAVRDFNAANGTTRSVKFSGGNENEADAAILRMACEKLIPEVLDEIAYGTSPNFRTRLLQYYMEAKGAQCEFGPEVLLPYGVDIAALGAGRMGLPDPNPVSGALLGQAPGLAKQVSAGGVSATARPKPV